MDRVESELRKGLGWAFYSSAMVAAFMVPWKAATAYGEPRHAVLLLLSSAAFFNSIAALWGLLRGQGRQTQASWRATLLLALVFALLTLLGNTASALSIARISAALLSVVQRCEVILVALLGALLLGERVGASFWLGTALSAVGLWLLKMWSSGSEDFDLAGVLYGLAGAACFGSMVLLTRRYITRVHLLPFNALRLWLSVVLWFVVEWELPTPEELPPGLMLNAALAGFFGPFLSRIGALVSGRYIPANLPVLASLSSPVLTLVFVFLVLGNLPTRAELLGGAVMLVGISIPVLHRLRAVQAAA